MHKKNVYVLMQYVRYSPVTCLFFQGWLNKSTKVRVSSPKILIEEWEGQKRIHAKINENALFFLSLHKKLINFSQRWEFLSDILPPSPWINCPLYVRANLIPNSRTFFLSRMQNAIFRTFFLFIMVHCYFFTHAIIDGKDVPL